MKGSEAEDHLFFFTENQNISRLLNVLNVSIKITMNRRVGVDVRSSASVSFKDVCSDSESCLNSSDLFSAFQKNSLMLTCKNR